VFFLENCGEDIPETALGGFACKTMGSINFELQLDLFCKAGDFRYFNFHNRE
jgi:hypothetical protein